jgi:hypothetical protein
MSRDSALFEYIGWLITQGGIPYYTALDIKTPLSYYFSSGLWVVAGGNPLWQHRLAVFVMVAAQIGLSLAIAYLVYDTTNSAVGAAVSGLAIYTLPAMYVGGARGLRPKTFMALAGVVAMLALVRERYFCAGVLGAVSAGFYQVGGAFALAVLGAALAEWRASGDRAPTARVLVGGFVVGVGVALPHLLTGTGGNLLINTVYYHTVITDTMPLADHLRLVERFVGAAIVLISLALAGVAIGATRPSLRRWLPSVFVLTALQPWYLDLNGGVDMVAWWAIVCIGLGVLVAAGDDRLSTPTDRRTFATIAVVTMLVLVGAGLPTYTGLHERTSSFEDSNELDQYVIGELYWGQQLPEDCVLVAIRYQREVRKHLGYSQCQRTSVVEFLRRLG